MNQDFHFCSKPRDALPVRRSLAHPAISVVIPCYNYGHFLPEALDSVFCQTVPAYEVIVVDDGSKDVTRQVSERYNGKVRYIRQSNAGVSAARNHGIRIARGEWVAFLDADDLWLPDKLALQSECIRRFSEAGLIGALDTTSHNSFRLREVFALFDINDLMGMLPFGTSSAVARRDLLLRAGLFNENRRWVEDRELWLNMLMFCSAARVNVPLWSYRLHPQQTMTDAQKMAENYAEVLAGFFRHHPQMEPLRSVAEAYWHYDSAMSYFEVGNRRKAASHLLRSFAVRPLLPRKLAPRMARVGLMARLALGGHFRRLNRFRKTWFHRGTLLSPFASFRSSNLQPDPDDCIPAADRTPGQRS